jgi:hypothetical protein
MAESVPGGAKTEGNRYHVDALPSAKGQFIFGWALVKISDRKSVNEINY